MAGKSTGPTSAEGNYRVPLKCPETGIAPDRASSPAKTPHSSTPLPRDATTSSSRPAPTNAFSSPLSWMPIGNSVVCAALRRSLVRTRSLVPKDFLHGLNEDGSLDQVFDSLDTFTRLEFSPLPRALT